MIVDYSPITEKPSQSYSHGEVVERPASAVKELVENSIDAGATRVDVVVRNGGRTQVIITDNGCGMSREELKMAVERHATSKLPNDDLMNISSLGFRGEALASIGAVSRLKLTSRRLNDESAWSLVVEGGKLSSTQPAKDILLGRALRLRIYFMLPRLDLNFLKLLVQNSDIFLRQSSVLAMSHPNIGFTLKDGDRNLLQLAPAQGDFFDCQP